MTFSSVIMTRQMSRNDRALPSLSQEASKRSSPGQVDKPQSQELRGCYLKG